MPANPSVRGIQLELKKVSPASLIMILTALLGISACGLTAQASTTASLSPSPLSFGNQTLNTTSSTKYITIKNTGTSSLTFSSMSMSGNFAFAGTGSCNIGASYAPGATCTVSVKFTPTATGTRTGTLTVKDDTSTGTQAVSLTGSGVTSTTSAPSISTSSLPGGTVSQSYSATLSATGGTTPYSWSIASGSLPSGLSLSSSGSISGAPSSSGSFSFSAKVTDSSGQTASRSLGVSIAAAISTPSISTSSLPGGTVSQSYSATLSATGGTTPYTWSIASGSLPGGLSLSSSGSISGTPSSSGSFSFSAKVTDGSGQTASKSLGISVANQVVNTSCSVFVSPSGSDSNTGTMAAPWRTLNHAFAYVRAGQTLCLRGGTYPQTTSSGYNQYMETSGSSSSPITITNYPGEVAVIQGPTRIETSFVKFLGTPNNSINMGLVFQGTSQLMDVVDVMNSHDVTLDHVEIRDGGYHAGIYQYGGYNIKLLGSYIHDNGRPGFSNTDNGVYWDATTGGGNLIANCVVEHNVAQGIQLYPSPSNVVVEENTFVNNGNWVALYGSNNTFVNNIVAGNGTASGNPQIDIEGTGYTINSNLVWDSNSSQAGILNSTGQSVLSLLTGNPLFVDPSNHNYQLQTGSLAICSGNSTYTQSVDKNNVSRTMPPSRGAYQQ